MNTIENNCLELLVFYINGQRYGVQQAKLDEILAMATIQPIPAALEFLAGMLNLRGKPLPVVDLTQHFSQPPGQHLYMDDIFLDEEGMLQLIHIRQVLSKTELEMVRVEPHTGDAP